MTHPTIDVTTYRGVDPRTGRGELPFLYLSVNQGAPEAADAAALMAVLADAWEIERRHTGVRVATLDGSVAHVAVTGPTVTLTLPGEVGTVHAELPPGLLGLFADHLEVAVVLAHAPTVGDAFTAGRGLAVYATYRTGAFAIAVLPVMHHAA